MITGIKITEKDFNDYKSAGEKPEVLDNLSRVNIFIGPNNSGKSRFLRELFSTPNLTLIESEYNIDELDNLVSELKNNIESVLNRWDVIDYNGLRSALKNIHKIEFMTYNIQNTINSLKDILLPIISIRNTQQPLTTSNGTVYSTHVFNDLSPFIPVAVSIIENYLNKDFIYTNYERTYIPILRGLRPIQVSGGTFDGLTDSYQKRTWHDYFANHGDGTIVNRISTGLNIYKDVQGKLLSKKSDRENVKAFEDFLKQTFFNGNDVTLIPEIGKDVLLIGIGGDEKSIHHLGDGIQSVIQILYPIFLNKGKKSLFFIEEPELNLHPGMQRILLNVLASDEFSDMQFFITTHSNHFLDLTFDNKHISIYKFNKNMDESFTIKNVSNPDHEILKDLGIHNSSVFLSNCTIWVEGVTDRRYIRKFLELYCKEHKEFEKFKEDMHYSFVEYAGSNIVHWNFDDEKKEEKISALKLNNNIFLIVDSDVKTSGEREAAKKERHEEFRKVLQNKLYITEGKEIENILSPDTIKHIVSHYEKSKVEDIVFKEGSIYKETEEEVDSFNSNQKIKKPIYWKENLGQFIDKELKTTTKVRATYADKSTVKDKEAFCELALEHMTTFDTLSEEAKTLCDKIFEFIKGCNPN